MTAYITTNTSDPGQSDIVTHARLGLGTDNPSSMLDITGPETLASNGVTIDPDLTLTGSSTTASHLSINTSGAGSIKLVSGISYSRVTTMDLNEPIIVENEATGITTAATLRIGNEPSEGDLNYALWVDDGKSRFDGNVGIGTDSPNKILHVKGAIRFENLPTVNPGSAGALYNSNGTLKISVG